jgi:hypothetical protein
VRRSGKLFGLVQIFLGFKELLTLSVGNALHHCFTHSDICGGKRGGKRFSQERKGFLIIRLVKEYLRFQYREAPSPFQVPACELRQGAVYVLKCLVRTLVTQRPENLIMRCLQMCD